MGILSIMKGNNWKKFESLFQYLQLSKWINVDMFKMDFLKKLLSWRLKKR